MLSKLDPTEIAGTAHGIVKIQHLPMVSLRLVREKTVPYEFEPLTNSSRVFDLFRPLAEDLDRETVWVACLDTKNRCVCLSQVAIGSLDSAVVHPREVLKIVLMANASAVILVHNHPSGDPAPSKEDHAMTGRIRDAAKTLGIRFLDHVIVGHGAFYSFCDQGQL